MKFLIGILTSKKIDKLDRCIQSALIQVDPKDIVIIINSLDTDYNNLAKILAEKYNLKSVITESNGKPGKGKNSLLRYFLDSDYEYLIPIDGDDILLPNAVGILANVAQTRTPDVLGLIDGLVLLDGKTFPIKEWQDHEVLINRSIENTEPKNLRRLNLHVAKIKKIASEQGNTLSRFVLLSKRGASVIEYDQELTGAEDIKQSLQLKLLQKQDKINYILLSSKDVYLYDVDDPGSCFAVCNSDPIEEFNRFWKDFTGEEINILQSFQLEYINVENGFFYSVERSS